MKILSDVPKKISLPKAEVEKHPESFFGRTIRVLLAPFRKIIEIWNHIFGAHKKQSEALPLEDREIKVVTNKLKKWLPKEDFGGNGGFQEVYTKLREEPEYPTTESPDMIPADEYNAIAPPPPVPFRADKLLPICKEIVATENKFLKSAEYLTKNLKTIVEEPKIVLEKSGLFSRKKVPTPETTLQDIDFSKVQATNIKEIFRLRPYLTQADKENLQKSTMPYASEILRNKPTQEMRNSVILKVQEKMPAESRKNINQLVVDLESVNRKIQEFEREVNRIFSDVDAYNYSEKVNEFASVINGENFESYLKELLYSDRLVNRYFDAIDDLKKIKNSKEIQMLDLDNQVDSPIIYAQRAPRIQLLIEEIIKKIPPNENLNQAYNRFLQIKNTAKI